jgi:hypothetical protein
MEENLRLFEVGIYSECVITCEETTSLPASTPAQTPENGQPPALIETTLEAGTAQRRELGQRTTQQELIT